MMKKIILLSLITFHFQLFAQFGGKPQYSILTTQNGDTLGTINVELFPTIAPLHVANFDSIVNAPISFDNRAFHRIIQNFMIQGGDPNSISGPESTWGYGDPSQQTVNAEFNPISHTRGTLSAARSANINSATSQFFICDGNPTHLDDGYTAYGKVVTGMNVVDTIANMPKNANDLPNDKISMFIDFIKVDSTVPYVAPTINSSSIALNNIVFSWNKADSTDFLTYKIQVSELDDFSSIAFQKDVDTTLTSYAEPLDVFNYETNYYWRVCSNNGGNLKCSESKTFTTLANGIEASTSKIVNIHPNPSTGIIQIEKLKNELVEVFNTVGLRILKTNEKSIDMSSFPKGIYLFKIGAEYRKVILK